MSIKRLVLDKYYAAGFTVGDTQGFLDKPQQTIRQQINSLKIVPKSSLLRNKLQSEQAAKKEIQDKVTNSGVRLMKREKGAEWMDIQKKSLPRVGMSVGGGALVGAAAGHLMSSSKRNELKQLQAKENKTEEDWDRIDKLKRQIRIRQIGGGVGGAVLGGAIGYGTGWNTKRAKEKHKLERMDKGSEFNKKLADIREKEDGRLLGELQNGKSYRLGR